MRICVCVKSVPDPDYYDSITIDPEKKTLVRVGIPTVINAADKHAIEEALRLKEQCSGDITVISMGPEMAKTQMLEALAMGADQAFLVSDRKAAGADSLATSYVLAKAIEKTGPYDVILAGNESADGATSHVPSQLGEWLGMQHIANVISLTDQGDGMIAKRQFENGIGIYEVKKPCVVGVNQRINQVRLTNALAILKAKKKPITILTVDDLGDVDEKYLGLAGSPSQNGDLHVMENDKNCTMIKAENEVEAAEQIYSIIAGALGL